MIDGCAAEDGSWHCFRRGKGSVRLEAASTVWGDEDFLPLNADEVKGFATENSTNSSELP
ncbi:MAG: hypothetical protein OXT74_01795 [Candidatus Poribacteria bacterium]|nr:hypothetical protein [Candidatus Poribacteria bacterium]